MGDKMKLLHLRKLRLLDRIDYLKSEVEKLHYKDRTFLQVYIHNSIDTTYVENPVLITGNN